VLLLGFGLLQARLANPLLPPRILRVGGLLSSSVVRGLTMLGMYSAFFLGALYLNRVLGYGPMQTGLAFLPMTLVVGGLSLGMTAWLVRRLGAQRLTSVGLLAIICGLGLLLGLDEHSSYFPRLFAAFGLIGLGAGMSFMPLLTIGLAEVPSDDAGLASGIVNVSMQLSAALGLAVVGSLSAGRTALLMAAGVPPTTSLLGGFQLSFAVALACVGVGLLLTQIILRPRRPRSAAVITVAYEQPDVADAAEWASRDAA
jgi:predicted MFS family arabinose efflux permease